MKGKIEVQGQNIGVISGVDKEDYITRQTVNRWEDGTMSPSFILEAKFEKFCENKKIKFEGDKA